MPDTGEHRSNLISKYYIYTLLLICLIVNSIFISIGFNKPILDAHSFRQTQTAISTYYTLINGYKLAYETPVLGKPWSIPFEFPLYQWIVAFFSKTCNIKLDQAGRLISIFFFYFSCIIVFYIMKSLSFEQRYCCIPVILLLCCPTYMFWSRTFMIESLATFLSLTYTLLFLNYYKDKNIYLFLGVLVFGILAAIVKITTFVVASVPIFVLLVYDFSRHLHALFWNKWRGRLRNFFYSQSKVAIMLIVPYITGIAWTRFADFHKSINPLAKDFITSAHLVEWNFGSWSQRLSLDYWEDFFTYNVGYGIGHPIIILVCFLVLLATYRYVLLVILSLFTFFSGPCILTNLYYMHYYYGYANSLYLLISISISIIALTEISKIKKFALYGLIPLCIIIMLSSYFDYYYKIQNKSDVSSEIPLVCTLIKAVTNPEDVLLIYGEDWNPTISYYSERKSIMNRWDYPLWDSKFQESITTTGKENISVLLKESRDDQLNEYFSCHPIPVMTCVYLREDIYKRAFMRLFNVDIGQSLPTRPLRISHFKGQFRLFSATGSTLAVPLSTSVSKLRAQFGVLFDAKELKVPAGVDFVITHEARDGTRTELFRTHLEPARSQTHRETCGTELNVGNLGAGKFLLETVPGPGKSCDWCYWSDIELN